MITAQATVVAMDTEFVLHEAKVSRGQDMNEQHVLMFIIKGAVEKSSLAADLGRVHP